MVSGGSRRSGPVSEGVGDMVPAGRGGRGRGHVDGQIASSSATPSVHASAASGRGRGRGLGGLVVGEVDLP